jgi:MFS transporter, OPA family, sugar phosphate sensor protein UhpC
MRPEPPEAPASWRARIFAATWLSYFSYYFTRMPFKASKSSLEEQFGLTRSQLNWIDTIYNIGYCVGQIGNGVLVERIGPRRWVSIGMLASAAAVVAFQLVHTLTGWLVGAYMLVWGLNGLAQSTGWPGNGKAMAEWNGTARRGAWMGAWSTCYQLGGMAATLLAARMIGAFGWRGVFIGPAIWVSVVAVAFYLLVRDRPSDVGFRDPDTVALTRDERRRLRRAELPRVLRTPMVWMMGAAYFCCKSIRYAFLFWLPYYLERSLHYSKTQSLDVSISFEVGGAVFVVAAGFLADHLFARRRVFTAFVFLLGLIAAVFLYQQTGGRSVMWTVGGLALVGGCLFAADSLISGAVAQDLGGPHAAGLAAGLINGIGSIGQVLQGFALVHISREYGWSTLFDVFMALAALGALCLVPYLRIGPQPAAR